MDKRIFITLIAIILLIGVFIGIKAMLKGQCEAPEIKFEPAFPEAGQAVRFSSIGSEEMVRWNFGDGSSSVGKDVEHRFDTAGSFSVVASIDENCSGTSEIVVRMPRKMQRVRLDLMVPAEIRAGDKIKFTETNAEAERWSWKILETGDSSAAGPDFEYVFRKAGLYKVAVSMSGPFVSGDTILTVDVKPAPVKPPVIAPVVKPVVAEKPKPRPAPPVIPKPKPEPRVERPVPAVSPYLDDNQFRTRFAQISNELTPGSESSEQASDDWRDIVLKQACPNQHMRVEVIDEDGEVFSQSDEDFKRAMMTGKYANVIVSNVVRGKDQCVLKVTVKVKTQIRN